ncbi:radical SAM protein [Archangium sp.]|uniref:radical SAM protein n=1 Tax=Archangium sp. TaxID=1872627 RepID=UPI002D6A3B1D|nr:radical SAM protein [Archangium sp.]HYO57745.1 radical SAM protein [Archangium sp.]
MSDPRPLSINWDVTYACPLRCAHCYSESGRRASRQLSLDDMFRVADALISLRPGSIQFSGGEPLLVKDLFQVAGRVSQAGIPVALYTSGWLLERKMLPDILRIFSRIHISVDGTTAKVHDSIRSRPGSFERAMHALALLDEAAREQRQRGGGAVNFGLDCVVVRSNFHQLKEFCTEIAPRFPEMKFLLLGAAIPSGLANRPGYTERELLTDEQLRLLASPDYARFLRSLAPDSVQLRTSDGLALQMHPERIASGKASTHLMHVEPDGALRGISIYEGTVGNLLEEPPQVLRERALARHRDPFVVETLSPVRTMKDWAEAARRIDHHFGSEEVRARIARRPEYTPRTNVAVLPTGVRRGQPADSDPAVAYALAP